MPRSREDIETQLRETEQFAERLREELANIQPKVLLLNGDVGGRTIEFAADGVHGQPRICVHRNDPYDSKVVAGLQLRLSDVPAVVAWLNYHFPKTEETA
jgi:hypothetical protein